MDKIITFEYKTEDSDYKLQLTFMPKGSGHGEDYSSNTRFRLHRIYNKSSADIYDFSCDDDLVTVECNSLTVTKSRRVRKDIHERLIEVMGGVVVEGVEDIIIMNIEALIKMDYPPIVR